MTRVGKIMHFLIDRIAIRRRRDLLVKPLIFFLAIQAVSLGSIRLVIPDAHSTMLLQFIVTAVVMTPFVSVAFLTINYMDALHRQLAELASTDVLTGLNNRRAFLDKAREALRQTRKGVLMVLDVDHFKQVNDSFGHAAGDACLQAVARRLSSGLRADDILGRIGGEEFALFLPHGSLAEAVGIGTRMSQPHEIWLGPEGPSLALSLSVGATDVAGTGEIEDFLLKADKALYHAKATGRSRLILWNEEIGGPEAQGPPAGSAASEQASAA